jgi:hypothetical protein
MSPNRQTPDDRAELGLAVAVGELASAGTEALSTWM